MVLKQNESSKVLNALRLISLAGQPLLALETSTKLAMRTLGKNFYV